MNYYYDINLLTDPEFTSSVLMNGIYSKLHRALFDLKSTHIGVSFPAYGKTLGNRLRLHGNESMLADLRGTEWLGAMKGFCMVSPISLVPENVQFRRFSRKQVNKSQAKLRRLIKRGTISKDQIADYQNGIQNTALDLPYLEVTSGSNGNKHRRFIELSDSFSTAVEGEFDQFGLSKTGTIPWF